MCTSKAEEEPLPFDEIVGARRTKRNPLVLVGAFATAGVLCAGLVAFRGGNAALSQRLMRGRVVAQGATVALMVATSGATFLSTQGDKQ